MAEKKRKRKAVRGFLSFVLCLEILILIFVYLLVPIKIEGPSMEPNLFDGEFGLMGRKNVFKKMPQYNDVVVVKIENDTNELIIKRTVGLPNDTIEIKGNQVYVNGGAFEDKYRNINTNMSDMAPLKLHDDEIFVLGDNRNVSLDSRTLGPIKIKQIQAIDGLVYWPLDRIHFME